MRGLISIILFGLLMLSSVSISYAEERIDSALKEQLMSALSKDLKDPMSVQFKDLRLGKDGTLCGELNAKNAYGGYTGFKPFMYRPNAESASILNVDGLPKSVATDEGFKLWTDALLHAGWLENYGCIEKGLSKKIDVELKKLIEDLAKQNRR